MACISVKFFSQCLERNTVFEVFVPNDSVKDSPRRKTTEMKTLVLLHGYRGDSGNWVPEYLTEKYNFAVVSPNGENSFWLDGLSTGRKFGTFLGCELPDYLRSTFGLADSSENTYIMGLSMGGFGALRTALAYPDVYGKAVGLSSALIVHQIEHIQKGFEDDFANYEYYRECFGELENVSESRNNPEVLARELMEKGGRSPEIFMACGTEDFLIENNREFHRYLQSIGYPHEYIEDKGVHDMNFWRKYAEVFCNKIFG